MNIKGFSVNHQLCCFREVFRNLPVYFVSLIYAQGLTHLRFDNDDAVLSEFVPVSVQPVCKYGIVSDISDFRMAVEDCESAKHRAIRELILNA